MVSCGLTGGNGLNGSLVDGSLGGSQSTGGLAHQLLGHINSLGQNGIVLSLGSGSFRGLGGSLGGV